MRFFLQSFGEVREFEWASNGSLYVDFKKTSVAETVSFPSIVLGFLVLDLLCYPFIVVWWWRWRWWCGGKRCRGKPCSNLAATSWPASPS